jgi:hypothetical protein
VILGLSELNVPVGIAFTLTALVTLSNAIEPFFNLRGRWIIMEDGQARFHRLQADIEFAMANSANGRPAQDEVQEFHERFQTIWTSMSDAWIAERRRGSAQS